MGKTRKSYTAEYKREAVKLVRGGLSAAHVGRDLGIGTNMVARWVREASQDAVEAFPGQGRLKSQDEELERLRKENIKLKAERDLLKKFAAYLAKESM